MLSRPGRASPPFLGTHHTAHRLLRSRRVAADNRAGWSGLLLAASGQLEEWKSSDEAKEKFTVEDPFAEEY